jgi:hypothetical protein
MMDLVYYYVYYSGLQDYTHCLYLYFGSRLMALLVNGWVQQVITESKDGSGRICSGSSLIERTTLLHGIWMEEGKETGRLLTGCL